MSTHAPAPALELRPFPLRAATAPASLFLRRRVSLSRPQAPVLPGQERKKRVNPRRLETKSGGRILFSRWLAAAAGKGVGLIVPLVVLTLWWAAAHWRWLPATILPAPAAVAQSFHDLLAGGDLLSNLGISLERVAKGFVVGGAVGLFLGLAMGFSPAVESWIGPLFRTVAQLPAVALIPLLIQFLGIEEGLKLFVMAKACSIPITFTASEGIRSIPAQYIEVARVFRLRRWTVIRKVILPGALPSIFTGVRQGLSHVWVSLVAVEILASSDGIGYLMSWGRLIFQLDVVLVCVGVIGLVGFLFDFGLKQVEARLLRWQGSH